VAGSRRRESALISLRMSGLTSAATRLLDSLDAIFGAHWGLESCGAASRSEVVMVAAGFNPRMRSDPTVWRRVATLDGLERTPVFNRRSATASGACLRTVG
jgi:hypothetical protein